MSGGTRVDHGGCNVWHVSTPEGLSALVGALKSHFGPLSDSLPTAAELARRDLVNSGIYG